MSDQLSAMREISHAESSIALVEFLQNEEVRESRQKVRAELSKKSMEDWSDLEKEHASRVTANYDVVGALVKEGIATPQLIASNWGPSIIHCYEVLSPWIEEHRERPGARKSYWSNFEWLYNEAKACCN